MELAARILQVDHAGENGAIWIYSGQIWLARLTAPHLLPELRAFREDEKRHRALFAAELARRGVRRCRSYLLCGLGGMVLGVLTGLCGARAISTTTVAVERVVLQHLQQQLAWLAGRDAAAHATVADIVAEEQQHHDDAATSAGQGRLARWLASVVSGATETVIGVGMRV